MPDDVFQPAQVVEIVLLSDAVDELTGSEYLPVERCVVISGGMLVRTIVDFLFVPLAVGLNGPLRVEFRDEKGIVELKLPVAAEPVVTVPNTSLVRLCIVIDMMVEFGYGMPLCLEIEVLLENECS